MANHKRKRSRRRVKCTMCTDSRNGNSKGSDRGKRKGPGFDRDSKAARKAQARREAFE